MDLVLNLLILLLILLIIGAIVHYILGYAEVSPELRKLVVFVLGILALVWVIAVLLGHAPLLPLRR